MFEGAPRRPALRPCLLFLSALLAWEFGSPAPVAVVLAVLVVERLAAKRRMRRFDLGLLCGGLALGILLGAHARIESEELIGRAALAMPIDRSFEASWVGTLLEAPKPIDAVSWRLRLTGRLESAAVATPTLELLLEVRTEDGRALARLRSGTRVRVWARAQVGDGVTRGQVKSPRLVEVLDTGQPSGVQGWRDTLHRRILKLYDGDAKTRDFLSAVLIGERTARQPGLERRLRAAGLSHMLAISGLHVGWVALVIFGVARRCRRLRWSSALLAGATMVLFGLLTGAGTPVRRAVGAFVLYLAGRTIGRDGDPLNRLACVAVAIGLVAPASVATPGFALSFAATAGILVAAAGVGGGSRPHLALRLSCAAYLATVAPCAAAFGQIAPWAPLANLLAVPCLVLVLASGYASLLLGDLPILGSLCISSAWFGVGCIDSLAAAFERLPLAPIFVASPDTGILLALAAAALFGWLVRPGVLRRPARMAFALLVVSLHIGPPPARTGTPGASLLDVGQGQALFWQDEDGTALVDAGGRGWGRWDPGAEIVRPWLLRHGVRRLDRLVVSHADADHAAGAFAVLEALEIGELWLASGWWESARLSDLAGDALDRGVAVRLVGSGDRAGSLTVHGPDRQRPSRPRSTNADSIVLTLGRSPWTLFVPGDLDGAPLGELIERLPATPTAALVLPHHGSRHGRIEPLLAHLRPTTLLASCGWRNRFGHPHDETLRGIAAAGLDLWRTDHHGHLRLIANGRGWRVSPENESAPR